MMSPAAQSAFRSAGLRLVGLDFLGDKLCEVNVFSTGGLRDAEKFTGKPFAADLARRLLSDATW